MHAPKKPAARKRTHHAHKSALVKVSGGAVTEILLYGVVGQVLVADTDEFAALTPEQRESKILLGYPTRIVDHAEFEKALEELVNPPAPDPAKETPAAPVVESADPSTPVQSPAPEVATVSPVADTATDPTAATAAKLLDALTPGTPTNEAVVAAAATVAS